MDFTKINFGRADAHTEGETFPELLNEGYLNISSVAEKAIDNSTFLFLGYKGSGKSSLSEHLRLRSTSVVVDQQQLKDFPFKQFDKILQTEDRIIKYKKLWRWILFVKVFANLYHDSSAVIKADDDISKLVNIFTQEGIFPLINISSLVNKSVKDTIALSLKHLNISREQAYDNVSVDIELLTDYLKNLLHVFKESHPHVLIIDDLDDILSPNGVQFSVLSALINEVKDINRFFNLSFIPFKIIVLCRTDMFERLPDPNKNKIKQDHSFTFTWYREGLNKSEDSDLVGLVNLRAKLVYPEIKDIFTTFFPKTYMDKKTCRSLLEFTRHTPRDFIQLINHIQSQCHENTIKVTSLEISNGIKYYSTEYFKQEIADEMAGYLSRKVIEGVFNVLSAIRSREFKLYDFIDCCKNIKELDDADVYEIMRVLYDCSAIGHTYSYNGGKTYRVTFKYRNRSSSFVPKDRIILHKGLWKALNVNY